MTAPYSIVVLMALFFVFPVFLLLQSFGIVDGYAGHRD